MKRRQIILWMLVAAGVAAWWMEHRRTAQLESMIGRSDGDALRLTELRREHARLTETLQEADPEGWRRDIGAAQATVARSATAPMPPARAATGALVPGEWSPARAWQDRGRATPEEAVETALWAAAGGDLEAFRRTVYLSDATRAAAQALWAQLPPAERARYASADDLVAAYSIARIPLGAAQLVWLNRSDENDALAAVFLRNPPGEIGKVNYTSAADSGPGRQAQDLPPMAVPDETSVTAYLALHRSADGWQLLVPPRAVTEIASRLAGPAGVAK